MKRLFLTVTALLAASLLAAQEQPRTVRLTLDEAIEMALDENPTIRIADMEIERQNYVRRETVGNLLPSLSASGDYSYSIVKQRILQTGLTFGADNAVTVGAALSVPLFVPAAYATLKLNDAQMADAVERARSSRLTMVNEVRKAYYNILLLEESLNVLRASEELMQETVDNSRRMYEAELGSEYDYLTAQSNLSSIKPSIIQAEGSVEVAELYLHMLLSLPADVEVVLVGSLREYSDGLDGSDCFTTDVSANSTLRSLEIQQQTLEAQLRVINSQRMPTVAAYGRIGFYGSDMSGIEGLDGLLPSIDVSEYPDLIGAVSGALGPAGMGDLARLMQNMLGSSSWLSGGNHEFWWQTPASVGVSVSIPIFSGNKINSQARQTKIAIEQLRMQRRYQEQATDMEVRTAISNLMTARSGMEANETAMAQAQKAYDISNVRYKGGMGTILELNSAQLQFTQAQLNYTQAVYDYLAARADYEQIIGRDYGYDADGARYAGGVQR